MGADRCICSICRQLRHIGLHSSISGHLFDTCRRFVGCTSLSHSASRSSRRGRGVVGGGGENKVNKVATSRCVARVGPEGSRKRVGASSGEETGVKPLKPQRPLAFTSPRFYILADERGTAQAHRASRRASRRASEGRPSGGGPGPRQGQFRESGLSGGGVCGMKVSPHAGGPSDRGGRAAR